VEASENERKRKNRRVRTGVWGRSVGARGGVIISKKMEVRTGAGHVRRREVLL